MKRALGILAVFGLCASWGVAVQPQVSSLTASQRENAGLVDISYDLWDPDSDLFDVTVLVYTNDGSNQYSAVTAATFSGDVGAGISGGTNRCVVWDVLKDLGDFQSTQVWVRVYAYDLTTRQVPTNDMVYVPEGWFNMGDSYGECYYDDAPVHSVYVSGFLVGKYEISNEQMRQVMQWGYDSGRISVSNAQNWTHILNTEGSRQFLMSFANGEDYDITWVGGQFLVSDGRESFPCADITWYGAQAYCAFRSEMEGLEPCIDFTGWSCDFSRNGYRLPTEAEWEKAARSGLDGQHFPWPSYGGDWSIHLDGSKANYGGSHDFYEPDVIGESGSSPLGYYSGWQSPPGCTIVNAYGLYDVAGNVLEWCQDWYGSSYYTISISVDPVGPESGESYGYYILPCRVIRGGAYSSMPVEPSMSCSCRCAYLPSESKSDLGFRIARRDPNANITMGYRTIRSEASSIYGPITVDTTGKDNPGVIQFSTSAISVDENAGMASLTVMRLGGTQGTATVDYVTANGTAVGGTDFTVASGTLSWADGDNTNQTITVNLTADSTSEGDETFSVLLSNPVGATIGTYTNVTVTIKDAGSQTPVYRLYSYGLPDSTYEHVWTTDWDEMATMSTVYGWYYEGVAWYAFSDYVQGSTPLYRVYAPAIRQHHYTTDGTEYYVLTEQSGGAWNGEGIQYYVYPDGSVTGTTPVYRFYHAGMGLHHFTISADEAAAIQATPEWGYTYEDIAFYVYP